MFSRFKRKPALEKSHSTVSSAVEAEDQVTYTWKAVNVTSYPKGRLENMFFSKKKYQDTVKHIVMNVNGIAKPGELMALMGASGAGKSTLLNSLTCRSSRKLLVTGQFQVNGLPVDNKMLSFISAYVEQEDVFLGNLTVMEHMEFAAKVVMSRGTRKKTRRDRVDDLLDDLNLTKCQDTRIGIAGKKKGISGGEKKRLAFATGLLNNPALLFCDEPTSGLDSFMSRNVVTMMKRLATQGRTIITTIHQPSSEIYYLFDKVMFLSEGKVAFLGTPQDAQNFFASVGAPCPENFNPADYFITRLATKYEDREPGAQPQLQFLQSVIDGYAKSKYFKRVMDDIEESKQMIENRKMRLSFRMDMTKHLRYQQSWFGQLKALLKRSFLDTMKSRELVTWKFVQTIVKMVGCLTAILLGIGQDIKKGQDFVFIIVIIWSTFLLHLDPSSMAKSSTLYIHYNFRSNLSPEEGVVAFLFGILYWNQDNDQDSVMNINGAIFISVVNLCLQNVFSVIHVFIDELPVFLREHLNGMYRVDAYYLSKTIVELPLQIALPVVYICIMYYMIKFNEDWKRFLWHSLVLIILSNIGTSFGYFIGICTDDLAFALNLATPIIISLVLFSGYMLNLETMTKWFSWLRYISWFYYTIEAIMVVQWEGVQGIKCTRPFTTCPQNGTVVLGMFSYKEENFEFDLYMMLVTLVVLRILGLGLLHIRVLLKE